MPMTEDGYVQGDGWVPGVDFDPSDPDEMEIMHVVWEREKYDAMTRLQRENESLRRQLWDRMTPEERDDYEESEYRRGFGND